MCAVDACAGESGDGAEGGGNEGCVYIVGDAAAADTWRISGVRKSMEMGWRVEGY